MIEDYPEEFPELIRVFCCLDNRNNQCSNDFTSTNIHQDLNKIDSFDYGGATELLLRDPSQVQYATHEYKKHSPLRWACIETTQEQQAMEFLETIRDIDSTQFLLQDSYGQLPIDGECVLNASLELLSFLLEIYLDYDFVCPNGVGMTEANFNPITCLCGSYWWEDIHQATEEIVSGKRTVSGKTVLEDNLGIENNFWKKIILLTKAFYHKTIEDDDKNSNNNNNNSDCENTSSMLRITNEFADRRVEFRLLHACAGIDWFPPNLLRLLVTAFPGSLLDADEDGNLPIHVASSGSFGSYRTIDASSWESGDLEANSGYQKTTIDILLEANPELSKIPIPEGRLPLELAIESVTKSSSIRNQKRRRPWEDGGIGSLLKAYPEAAKIRSPVTGKLPLEMTLGRGSFWDWEDGLRELLCAYPEVAKLRNPRTGKYPLQLAIERETHFDKGVYGLLEVSPKVAWASSVMAIPSRGEDTQRTQGQKRKCNNTNQCLPLFAHAALEKCSASVVYKLLRTNPESCRRCFEKPRTATVQRKKRKLA